MAFAEAPYNRLLESYGYYLFFQLFLEVVVVWCFQKIVTKIVELANFRKLCTKKGLSFIMKENIKKKGTSKYRMQTGENSSSVNRMTVADVIGS